MENEKVGKLPFGIFPAFLFIIYAYFQCDFCNGLLKNTEITPLNYRRRKEFPGQYRWGGFCSARKSFRYILR